MQIDTDGDGDVCDVCPGGDDSMDNNGDGIPDCSQLLPYDDYADEWKCKNNNISVCHIPPGNPANTHTICISYNALAAHFNNHGDNIGPCVGCEQHSVHKNSGDSNLFSSLDKIDIYPNPASFEVNISLEGFTNYQGATLNVHDNFGKLVYAQNLQGELDHRLIKLNVDEFISGIYHATISSEDVSLTKRFLVIK